MRRWHDPTMTGHFICLGKLNTAGYSFFPSGDDISHPPLTNCSGGSDLFFGVALFQVIST